MTVPSCLPKAAAIDYDDHISIMRRRKAELAEVVARGKRGSARDGRVVKSVVRELD